MSLKMYTFCTVVHCQQHKCWFCCPLTIPLTFQSTFFLKLHWVLWCHDTTCRLFYPSVFSVYLKRQSWVGNFCSFWERPCRLIWCPVGGLIGGCGARAVSCKTPIYFIYRISYIFICIDFIHFGPRRPWSPPSSSSWSSSSRPRSTWLFSACVMQRDAWGLWIMRFFSYSPSSQTSASILILRPKQRARGRKIRACQGSPE